MSEQQHSIKRQVIELTMRDATQAGVLYDDISRIYRQRIVPLIEQCCDELSTADRLYRIERLELDLGMIRVQHLEADLVAGVRAALRPALAAQINKQPSSADQPYQHQTNAWLELLALFARTGNLPWWADPARPHLLESGLAYLVNTAPEPLQHLIAELAQEHAALQRLVDHLPDASLTRLAARLVPALHNHSLDQIQALIKLLGHLPASPSHTHIRRSVWITIMQVASVGGQHYLATEMFYQALLRRIALTFRRPYTTLLADLQHEQEQHTSTPDLLTELLDLLVQQSSSTEQPTITALAEQRQPAPTNALLHAQPESSAAHMLAHHTNELRRFSPMPLQSPTDASPRLPVSPSNPRVLRDLHDSDANELYIGNAGIAILWPFLSSFFSQIGLVDGQHFIDQAAQQRAAGLLQHIATGDLAFPEYVLPLNKLLCGLELTELFEIGEPLRDDEMAACAELLGAIIAQAPILRGMSLPGFRGTFLLRKGVLSTRDGMWLLRVERHTYDIVVDRFPWNWQWVLLPWMNAPLRVEW